MPWCHEYQGLRSTNLKKHLTILTKMEGRLYEPCQKVPGLPGVLCP